MTQLKWPSWLYNMDLFAQQKLTKNEWMSIEVPVSAHEKQILQLLIDSYTNPSHQIAPTQTLLQFLNISYSPQMEDYLFAKYYAKFINSQLTLPKVQLNSADKIRLAKYENVDIMTIEVYETILIKLIHSFETNKYYCYYTVGNLYIKTATNINKYVRLHCETFLRNIETQIDMKTLICNATVCIERNKVLQQHGVKQIYSHQRQLFDYVRNDANAKLILYTALTGCGKTISAIAFEQKVIFMCAARHIGLALAKNAISVGKRVAFAFGCNGTENIRLHYFAAKDYTKNKRSGGIGKVDNSVGDNVDIMICDVKSYIHAMNYMLAFFDASNIITYWDEPTISMDYETHEIHDQIRFNWTENRIPTVVLSSATLPPLTKLDPLIQSFCNKFEGANVYNIRSYDCKKTVQIINNDGRVVVPHTICNNEVELHASAHFCLNNYNVLRYLDVNEITKFIALHYELMPYDVITSKYTITVQDIKIYYLQLLTRVNVWIPYVPPPLFVENNKGRNKIHSIDNSKLLSTATASLSGKPLSKSYTSETGMGVGVGVIGIHVTTSDAYTLTDGPTLFMTQDTDKMAKFCIQEAGIPSIVMDDLMKKIEYNNQVNKKIWELEKEITAMEESLEKGTDDNAKNKTKDKVFERGDFKKLTDSVNNYRGLIKNASLQSVFVPNTVQHLDKWTSQFNSNSCPFTSDISETVVKDIMALHEVNDVWKILLMMGIGVFSATMTPTYTEIMKQLADNQKLFMIIASSDYIYGTNYQFCHGYIAKDLVLTREKTIQAMGRIGRTDVLKSYTVRFRNTEVANSVFKELENENHIEANNLNRLLG